MPKFKALTENKMALFNILSTVLISSINFITVPIFTRMLDTAGFGIVNVYVAWVQIFTVIVGLQASGSIGIAHANLKDDEQDGYQFNVLLMSLVSFVVVIAICISCHQFLSVLLNISSELVILMCLQSYGAFLISFFNMRFIFEKKAQLNLLLSVGVCLATTVLSIVLIVCLRSEGLGELYMGRVWGLMIPNLMIGALMLVVFFLKNHARISVRYWRFCLVLTLPLILHTLSQVILSQTGKIALQSFDGDSVAGIYSVAVVVVNLLSAIYGALNNAFVPFMYDDLAGKTSEGVKQSHFRNYFRSFTLGTCAFALLAPEIVKVMSSEQYWSCIEVLPYLVIGQYCVFLYSFPVNYEFFRARTSSVAVGTVLAALINISLVAWLVPAAGMVGGAIATMMAYFFLFAFHLCIARFRLGDRSYSISNYFVGLAFVGLVAALQPILLGQPIIRWCVGLLLVCLVAYRIARTRSIF